MSLSASEQESGDGQVSASIDGIRSDTSPDEVLTIDLNDEISAIIEIYQTALLPQNDVRRTLFKEAIEAEVKRPFANNTFVVVNKSDFTNEEIEYITIRKTKLLIALKYADTLDEKKKACLVVHVIGKIDKGKKQLFTYSPIVTRASVRVFLCGLTQKGLKIYLRDISRAYVSSESKLLRVIYIVPPNELGLHFGILWKVFRSFYGLPESGVTWFETYIGHHHDHPQMKSAETDPCFLYRRDENGDLQGLVYLQVDDSICAGTAGLLLEEAKASRRFKTPSVEILADGKEIRFNRHFI